MFRYLKTFFQIYVIKQILKNLTQPELLYSLKTYIHEGERVEGSNSLKRYERLLLFVSIYFHRAIYNILEEKMNMKNDLLKVCGTNKRKYFLLNYYGSNFNGFF